LGEKDDMFKAVPTG